MRLSEFAEPIVPPVYDQLWITAISIGIAVWLLVIALFFLILYAVIVTAIRRGMRDHLIWAEARERSRTATGPQNLR